MGCLYRAVPSSLGLLLAASLALGAHAVRADPIVVPEPLDAEDRPESGEPAAGTPLWLAVTGQETFSTSGPSTGVSVAVGGAFDELAAPRHLRTPRKRRAASDEAAFDAFDDPIDDAPRAAPMELASDERDPRADTEQALVINGSFARGIVRAAMHVAKRGQAHDRLDGLATRAKVSALLPEVRFRVGQNVDQVVALAPTVSDPSRTTASDGAKLLIEGRATFKLDRLVFADEEVQVEKLRIDREHGEKALVNEILRRLEAWQRAEFASHDPDVTGDAAIEAEVQAVATSAALDVLSDGWFSAHLADLRVGRAKVVAHEEPAARARPTPIATARAYDVDERAGLESDRMDRTTVAHPPLAKKARARAGREDVEAHAVASN
jgi:hypothetical protein